MNSPITGGALPSLSNLGTARSISADAMDKLSTAASISDDSLSLASSQNVAELSVPLNQPINTANLVFQERLVSYGPPRAVREFHADPQSTFSFSSGSYSLDSLYSAQASKYRVIKKTAEQVNCEKPEVEKLQEVRLDHLDGPEPRIYDVSPAIFRAIQRRLKKDSTGVQRERCSIVFEPSGDQLFSGPDFVQQWDATLQELYTSHELAAFKMSTTLRKGSQVPEIEVYLKSQDPALKGQPIDMTEKPFDEWRLEVYQKKAKEYIEKQRELAKGMSQLPFRMDKDRHEVSSSSGSSTVGTISTARLLSGTTQVAGMIGLNILEKLFGM